MIDTLNIGSFIYDTIKADKQLTDILGISTNVFPIVAEDGTDYPFVTYRRTGLVSNNCKDGYYEDIVRVEIKAICATYIQSVQVINRIRELFECQHIEYENMTIEDTSIENASENYEYNAFTQTINLVFKIND